MTLQVSACGLGCRHRSSRTFFRRPGRRLLPSWRPDRIDGGASDRPLVPQRTGDVFVRTGDRVARTGDRMCPCAPGRSDVRLVQQTDPHVVRYC